MFIVIKQKCWLIMKITSVLIRKSFGYVNLFTFQVESVRGNNTMYVWLNYLSCVINHLKTQWLIIIMSLL